MPERKKVRIGALEMPEYAVQKPIGIRATGEFVSPKEVVETPSLALGSLLSLGDEQQIRLSLERTRLEPEFKLGIPGLGIFTKEEVMGMVGARTELGLEFVRADMRYCDELAEGLRTGASLKWPEMPADEKEPIPKEWEGVPKKYWRLFRSIALFCENDTDPVTQKATPYRVTHVHPVFAKRGFLVVVRNGASDDRPNFVPVAKNPRTRYIGGIGHGNATTYTGHMSSPILTVGSYDAVEVRGKSIHFLSCQTARQLGPDTVKKAARAYGGYYENFTFVYDQPGTPVNEMELFWKCDSTLDICMALGATAAVAHAKTILVYNVAIASVPNTEAAKWLTWDRNALRTPVSSAVYGQKEARVSPWITLPAIPLELGVEEEEEERELVGA